MCSREMILSSLRQLPKLETLTAENKVFFSHVLLVITIKPKHYWALTTKSYKRLEKNFSL